MHLVDVDDDDHTDDDDDATAAIAYTNEHIQATCLNHFNRHRHSLINPKLLDQSR